MLKRANKEVSELEKLADVHSVILRPAAEGERHGATIVAFLKCPATLPAAAEDTTASTSSDSGSGAIPESAAPAGTVVSPGKTNDPACLPAELAGAPSPLARRLLPVSLKVPRDYPFKPYGDEDMVGHSNIIAGQVLRSSNPHHNWSPALTLSRSLLSPLVRLLHGPAWTDPEGARGLNGMVENLLAREEPAGMRLNSGETDFSIYTAIAAAYGLDNAGNTLPEDAAERKAFLQREKEGHAAAASAPPAQDAAAPTSGSGAGVAGPAIPPEFNEPTTLALVLLSGQRSEVAVTLSTTTYREFMDMIMSKTDMPQESIALIHEAKRIQAPTSGDEHKPLYALGIRTLNPTVHLVMRMRGCWCGYYRRALLLCRTLDEDVDRLRKAMQSAAAALPSAESTREALEAWCDEHHR